MWKSSGKDGGRSARHSRGGSFKPGYTTGQTGSSRYSSTVGNILPSEGRGSIKPQSTPHEESVKSSGVSRRGTSTGQSPSYGLGSNLPSNTLTVKGIPGDCSAREASHIFRQFSGWKALKLYPTSTGPTGTIHCTVTFENATCAEDASKKLKGYAFDLNQPSDYRLSVEFGPSPHTPRHSVSHASR